MTTKVQGTEGIEFPDGSVQSSAAYDKAESDEKYLDTSVQWISDASVNSWYSKRADGTITYLFRLTSALSAGNAYGTGGLYMYSVAGFGLPIPMVGIVSISGSGVDQLSDGWAGGVMTDANTFTLRYWSTSPQVTSSVIVITITGRWK